MLRKILSLSAIAPAAAAPLYLGIAFTDTNNDTAPAVSTPAEIDFSASSTNDAFSSLVSSRLPSIVASRAAEARSWINVYDDGDDNSHYEYFRLDYALAKLQEDDGGSYRTSSYAYYTDKMTNALDPTGSSLMLVFNSGGSNSNSAPPSFIFTGDKKYNWKIDSVVSNNYGSTAVGSYENKFVGNGANNIPVGDAMKLSVSILEEGTNILRYPSANGSKLWAFPKPYPYDFPDYKYAPDGASYFRGQRVVQTTDNNGYPRFDYHNTNIWTSMGIKNWRSNVLPKSYFYDPAQLFALGGVGFDPSYGKDGGYYHQLGLNTALISGAVGMHFDSATNNLLESELGASVVNAGKAATTAGSVPVIPKVTPSFIGRGGEVEYWRSLPNFSSLAWGPGSWVDPSLLSANQYDQYWTNVASLNQVLHDLNGRAATGANADNSYRFNYANYLATKDAVRKYVATNRTFPSNDWVRGLFTSTSAAAEPAVAISSWTKGAIDYKLGDSSLDDLAFVLRDLKVSEWSQFATDGRSNWDNVDRSDDVGAKTAVRNGKTVRYSTYQDIIEGKNRVYINDPSTTSGDSIKFSIGVDVLSDIQNAKIDDRPNEFATAVPIKFQNYEKVLNGGNFGINSSNLATAPAGTTQSENKIVQGVSGGTNFFSFSKKGFKVVELKTLLPAAEIVPNEDAAKLSPTEAMATSEELKTPYLALRSRLVLKNDNPDKTVFPFAFQNPYDNTWTYDISEKNVKLSPEDSSGSMKVDYTGDDGKVVYSTTIKGFRSVAAPVTAPGDSVPVENIPGPVAVAAGEDSSGFPAWAIAVASVGGAAVLGGATWFGFARKKSLRRRHKKARGRDGTDLG